MTWMQYAILWRQKYLGDTEWLTREQAAQYIGAATRFAKASLAIKAMLILRLKK